MLKDSFMKINVDLAISYRVKLFKNAEKYIWTIYPSLHSGVILWIGPFMNVNIVFHV